MSQEGALTLSSLSAGVFPASERRERESARASERERGGGGGGGGRET
jgi:hypothetical protein